MGDPHGIGPEICARALAKSGNADCVLIGDQGRFNQAAEICGIPDKDLTGVTVVQSGPSFQSTPFGKVDAKAGLACFDYLQLAIDGVLAGTYAGIVTAPINKAAWSAAGIGFPGHTEVLAKQADNADVVMMLANKEIRTVLVSIHVSLLEACKLVTFEREVSTIQKAHEACLALGIANPRVAVCGLNPHAGEGGLFGREDEDVIRPAIEACQAQGIDASGPWPGDTIFATARKGHFDMVVAQYHDQGLIPVKYMGVDDGINATMGLPFVRTSPDHGTAYDIAGKGIASSASMETAIAYARQLIAASNQP